MASSQNGKVSSNYALYALSYNLLVTHYPHKNVIIITYIVFKYQ